MTDQDQDKQQQAEAARAMIKAVYDEGVATINGRDYKITKMNHKQRRKVFAFTTSVSKSMEQSDFSFLDSPEFEAVEKIINDVVTFDDQLISKMPDHWDNYPEDYITFITTMLGVISYPFMSAGPGA